MPIAQSFLTPNFSGVLFNKGNEMIPFINLISGNRKITQHVEFSVCQTYDTGARAQPLISETASLTAPPINTITRAQQTNVTQIFHESVGVSWAKESNMQTISGINMALNEADPSNELAWQIEQKMIKIAGDMEFSFLQGIYAKAVMDTNPNRTRGLASAITTNTVVVTGALTWANVTALQKKIFDAYAPTSRLTLLVDGSAALALQVDAKATGLIAFPMDRTTAGIAVTTYVTVLGIVDVLIVWNLPAGNAVLCNPKMISIVEQPHPKYGNFFLKQMGITGAAEPFEIFGQVGLDHGPEWYHGKITGIV